MENPRYIIVSDLYNAILLLLRSLRYALSNNTNVYKINPREMVFVVLKVDILLKKSLMKNGKSQAFILNTGWFKI